MNAWLAWDERVSSLHNIDELAQQLDKSIPCLPDCEDITLLVKLGKIPEFSWDRNLIYFQSISVLSSLYKLCCDNDRAGLRSFLYVGYIEYQSLILSYNTLFKVANDIYKGEEYPPYLTLMLWVILKASLLMEPIIANDEEFERRMHEERTSKET